MAIARHAHARRRLAADRQFTGAGGDRPRHRAGRADRPRRHQVLASTSRRREYHARGGPVLVIRRRPGEILVIDGCIEIEILDAGSSSVKLGIPPPREIPVIRKEIQIAGDQNRAAAREISPTSLQYLLLALKTAETQAISPL